MNKLKIKFVLLRTFLNELLEDDYLQLIIFRFGFARQGEIHQWMIDHFHVLYRIVYSLSQLRKRAQGAGNGRKVRIGLDSVGLIALLERAVEHNLKEDSEIY